MFVATRNWYDLAAWRFAYPGVTRKCFFQKWIIVVADVPQGYQDISEEDQKKAQAFFERGRSVADTGNFEYAIEMYLQGLNIDPDAVDAHKALRDVSLKRKASGGKDLGMFEKMRIKRQAKEPKHTLLTAEKLLAYDPGNTDHMITMLRTAQEEGFYDTVLWIGPILQKANADSTKPPPNFDKFITLKDVYKSLRQWKLATDACHYAVRLRPDEMNLQTELKNLGAQQTMSEGQYEAAGSFRKSMRNLKLQEDLLEKDKDVRSLDALTRSVKEAEAEYQADPQETGKLMKLVEALVRTEQTENENRAMELLAQTYERTKQFRFRHSLGRIRLTQLSRQERLLRAQVQADPKNEDLRRQYSEQVKSQTAEELKEYTLFADNYPTDMTFRYQIARRLFTLGRFNDAIPVFQHARNDPKFRIDAGVFLGRAFLESNFNDEAVDTLRGVLEEYPIKGDARSIDMNYWYGRSLEQKGDVPVALKAYSQVAQWDFNFRDVQARIKKLRA